MEFSVGTRPRRLVGYDHMTAKHRARLRNLLASDNIVVATGIYDTLTAWLSQKAGFEAVFLSGSAVAISQLARPDIGLVTMSEIASTLERIRDRIELPIIADADSGFGNAFHVQRTVRMLERAGASGIQIEDQLNTKKPKDVQSRPLVSTEEMVGKIKAAQDAKQASDTVISARTDSFFTEGLQASLDRAEAYLEAGADMIFVEGLQSEEDLQLLCKRVKGRAPLLYNMLAQGKSPALKPDDLAQIGFSIVLYPATAIESATHAVYGALTELKSAIDGSKDTTQKAEHSSTHDILDAANFLKAGERFGGDN